MTHAEIAKKEGMGQGWNSCHPGHLFIVREGLQCGNCLAVTRDHGRTWEQPSKTSKEGVKA